MNTSTDISHQSSKNVLAAYSFEQKEKVGEEGWEWIQVLTQDTYGYSGGDTRADRLAAAKKNTEKWMEVAADPLGNMDYIMGADVPMLFLRHILEMKNALATEGGPQNFESGLPAHMDATTSGIQILAGISKDGNAARIANLTDTLERGDSYSEVVAKVLDTLSETPLPENHEAIKAEFYKRQQAVRELAMEAANIEDKTERALAWDEYHAANEEFAAWKKLNKDVAAMSFWFQEPIREKFRKIFKGPVMTKYYSSTKGGMMESLYQDFKDIFVDKDGNTLLNKTFTAWLADKIYDGADGVFEGPGRVMDQMVLIGKEVADADKAVIFNNPISGFKIVNDPKVEVSETIRFNYNGKNEAIKKRNASGRIESKIAFDGEERWPNKQKSQIAPLVVHSLDAAIVHYIFMNADFPVQTIHDSFATTPAHTQKLYHLIRQGFYEITKGDVLLDIMEQIYRNADFPDWKARAREKFDATQIGTWDPKGVLNNEYAFSAGVTDPKVAERILNRKKVEPAFSLAENFESEMTTEAVSAETSKIETESKPCK